MEENKCKFCGKVFSRKCNLVSHENYYCNLNPNKKKISEKKNHIWKCDCGVFFKTRKLLCEHKKECEVALELKKSNHNLYISEECPFCKKTFNTTKNAFTIHKKSCLKNPNRVKGSSHIMSEEIKKKISETMKKKFAEGNNNSIWHTQMDKRKSYAEQYFDKCFPELKQNYHALRYFLDLADPLKKLYLEIDGEQHYNDPKVVKHDKERTKLLEENGWLLVDRIRWSDFKKLSKEEREKKINNLKIKFSSMNRNDIIEENKKELLIKEKEDKRKSEEREKLLKEGKIDKSGKINNIKLSFEEIEKRKNLILNCGVDLQKYGWITKVVNATGLTKKQIYLIIDKEKIKCFKEKNNIAD